MMGKWKIRDVKRMFETGGFILTKFASNRKMVLNFITSRDDDALMEDYGRCKWKGFRYTLEG